MNKVHLVSRIMITWFKFFQEFRRLPNAPNCVILFTLFLIPVLDRSTGATILGSSHAEHFKAFIEHPPVIQIIVWERTNPDNPTKPPEYFTGRWQPNASFVNICSSLSPAENAFPDPILPRMVSHYDSNYWSYFDRALTLWRDEKRVDEFTNPVIQTFDWECTKLANILNFGITYAAIGSIRWVGDSFSYTNSTEGTLHGKLFVDGEGRAQYLNLHLDLIDPAYADPRPFDWEIRYGYEKDTGFSFLPSSLRYFLITENGKKRRPLDKIVVHQLITNSPSGNAELFVPNHYVATGSSNTYYVVGTNRVYYPKTNQVLIVNPTPGKNHTMKGNEIYQFFAGVVVLVPALGFLLLLKSRRSKNNSKQK